VIGSVLVDKMGSLDGQLPAVIASSVGEIIAGIRTAIDSL
jgi:hypothetical protein